MYSSPNLPVVPHGQTVLQKHAQTMTTGLNPVVCQQQAVEQDRFFMDLCTDDIKNMQNLSTDMCILRDYEAVALPGVHNVHTENLAAIEPLPMSRNPVQHTICSLFCELSRGFTYIPNGSHHLKTATW